MPPKTAKKAPAAAPSAAKKENKPPAAAAASGPAKSAKAPAPAPAAAKKPAEPKKAPAPAAAPKAEKKPAPAPEAPKAAEAKKPKPAAPAAPKVKKAPAPPKKKPVSNLKGKSTAGGRKKKVSNRFVIDCTLPAEDQLFNCADFEKFLRERIKVQGKTSNFGGNVNIERGEKNKLAVNASIPFSKRYLKYLTKKYLKKNLLRDTLRVIATSRDGYELRYFQIGNEADDEEEDAE